MALLRFADLGVSGLEIEEPDEAMKAEHQRVTRVLREALGDKVRVGNEGRHLVRVEHRTEDRAFALRLAEESSGLDR